MMKIGSYETFTIEKPVTSSLLFIDVKILMGNAFALKWRYRSFQSYQKQAVCKWWKKCDEIDNHTLMLDMLHSYMSVVYTCHCRGVLRNIV